MDSYTEIRNKIRSMTGQKTPLLLTAKVESVDGETCTVSVGDLKLTGTRLRSVVNGEESKLLITPKVGSHVTIIDLSGELRETEVVGFSEIESIDIETASNIGINCNGDVNIDCDGTVTFNGGDNHGLAKVDDVTKKLNAIENDINNLKTAFAAWTPVVYDGGATLKTATAAWAAQQLVNTQRNELENEKVKH